MDYLKQPLTPEEIEDIVDENYYIEGIVAIKDREMINLDYESFLDTLSEKLTGSPCLQEIQETMVGCIPEKNLVLYKVVGDASGILDCDY